MAPIKLRTYSRRPRPRVKSTEELLNKENKSLALGLGLHRSKRIPLKPRPRPRHKQQILDNVVLKPPCDLFNALFGVNSNVVTTSKASLEHGSPEVFLRQESCESSFSISVDSTFDKLLKGESVKPVSVGTEPPIRVMKHMETEVVPMYPPLPYSLEIHTDEELPSSFFKIPSKLEDDMSSRILKVKISSKHDLNQMKFGILPSTKKIIKSKVKRSPQKCSYELRPRSRTKYYLSQQKPDDGTCSLSSSSSPFKTSKVVIDDSEIYQNQENTHPLGEECSHIHEKNKRATLPQFTTRDTSTPLKNSKKSTANISFLSPISFIENSITYNLTSKLDPIILTDQADFIFASQHDSVSPTSPDAKQAELSLETVNNILSSNSFETEESSDEMPFKGWSPNEGSKVLKSIDKFQLFDSSTVDLSLHPDVFDMNKIPNLELIKESKEPHLPLTENTSNNFVSTPLCSNNALSAESSVVLPKEEIMHSNTEAAPGSEHESTGLSLFRHTMEETAQNVVMSARGHRLQWCTQPLPDFLEDQGTLDAIEEEGEEDMPLEQLPRGFYNKRFKQASSSVHTSEDTPTCSFSRRSSIYGSVGHRKSRMSHIVIPGKLLAQPKPQSRTFRDLHGISDLDGGFQEVDSDPIGLKCTEEDAAVTARNVVLQRCHQRAPVPFSEAFSDVYLNKCRKIGEGVYGEVFMWQDGGQSAVLKIIPIEGDELVNGERQKKFSEILSEIVITTELSNLRLDCQNQTNGFTEVLHNWCIQDKYPEQLIRLWKQYAEEKHSENDCPAVFSESQLFIVLVLANGGQDLEQFQFNNAKQSKSILLQTAYALAVAEQCLEFEHRDLHWGNVLISQTKEKSVTFKLDGEEHCIPTNGVQVTIIDFTLSRMTYDGCCIFNDLSQDPDLFDSHGDYQFDIYRSMRETCSNNWNEFVPFTNVSWLHYLVDKMTASTALGVHYHHTKSKVHKNGLKMLKDIKTSLLSFTSAVKFVQSLDIKMTS